MSEKINKWVERFYYFDIYTDYSDDHRVWKEGLNARGLLKRDVAEANFTEEEKQEILRLVGLMHDEAYLKSTRIYPSLYGQPLWNEGAGPDRRKFVEGYLGVYNELD